MAHLRRQIAVGRHDDSRQDGRRLADIQLARADVWGGDWNHALSGKEQAGSLEGRAAIATMAATLGLHIATADQPHRLVGLLTIDHIAVPATWHVTDVERHAAEADGIPISDHDAYVVEVAPTED